MLRPRTIYLSRLIGLFALVLSLAMVLHRQAFAEIASLMVHDRPLLFLVGLMLLAIGLAMVLTHNIWSGGVLPIVVTLFGWLQLVRGLVFLLAPPDALAAIFERMNFEKYFNVGLGVTIALGAYLTYAGFRERLR